MLGATDDNRSNVNPFFISLTVGNEAMKGQRASRVDKYGLKTRNALWKS
jgi:hypothetical protein